MTKRVPIEDVFSKLRAVGPTNTADLANKLGIPRTRSLGSRLSKQFLYGKLDREEVRVCTPKGAYNEFVWRVK